MKRRQRLECLLAIGLCAFVAAQACADPPPAGPDAPNIVLVIGDDHGWPYFGFMGDAKVKTPHLDRLAQEGVVFPYGFTTASTCRPSLRSLLTGLHPVQWRARHRALRAQGRGTKGGDRIRDFATLPRELASRGYVSFQGGKYWESSYQAAGFSEGTKAPAAAEARDQLGWMQRRAGGAGLELGRSSMQPLWDFLEAHRDERFFVWFAPKLPHTPHDPPEELLALYADASLSEPARRYYANITRFDAVVGELVARLEQLGLREKTLVVYLSDNGWEQEPGATNRVFELGGPTGKSSMYELGFRTPVIFSWPGRLPGGRKRVELVSSVDLFSTLLDFAGLAPPPDRTGISLRPALVADAAFPRETIIGSMGSLRPPRVVEDAKPNPSRELVRSERAYFLRNESWHYIWYAQHKRYGDRVEEELYRIDRDPREERNVASEHPDLAKAFRAEIERWLDEVVERTKSAT